jgi:hypothetical protein
MENLLKGLTHRSPDEEIPFILEHWEPNVGINPIKEAPEKMTREEAYQKVVDYFSYYKEWKKHGYTFDSIYHNVRGGCQGGSFEHGEFISVGGYLGSKSIGSDKVVVSWESGKQFIFTVRQILEDVLGENEKKQLSLF